MKKIQLSFLFVVALVLVSAGLWAQPQLVGPMSYGGPVNGGGLFRMNLPGTAPGVIHGFFNLNPHRPTGGVCIGNDEWLYGSLTYNGTNNEGAAYRIRRDGTGFLKLFDFGNGSYARGTPYYHTDGKLYFNGETNIKIFDPVTMGVTDLSTQGLTVTNDLLIDADDYIYFINLADQLVRIKTDGSIFEPLHQFTTATEGNNGVTGVTEIPGNIIFGVMKNGGTDNGGTIFSINKNGTGFNVHHQFSQATGFEPESKLFYFDGKLFGTARQGGNNGLGVLYAIDADGTNYRVLRHFTPSFATGDPFGNIQVSADGRIFGCYPQHHLDNSFFANRLWKVDTSGDNIQNFFQVDQREHGQFNLNILLTNDTIILTTREMGRHQGGVITTVDTFGSATALHHFGTAQNGFWPNTGLIRGSDARLYGTTSVGGTDGNGLVYSINAAGGGFIPLHKFTDAEGFEPVGELLEASNGKIYGALRYGGPINTGCIYRMDKTGLNFQIIYNFPDVAAAHTPVGDLIEGPGQLLYGMFEQSSGGSGLFRMNLDGGNFTVLKYWPQGELNGPRSGLRLYRGYLYGFSYSGGSQGRGGIFRIRIDGTGYQAMHEFDGTDGGLPMESPVIGRTDGKIYGTSSQGGAAGYGNVFTIDTSGANFTVIHDFTTNDSYPQGQLIQASDGLLYGTTFWSNINPGGGGIVFRMNLDGSNFTTIKEFNSQTEGAGLGSIMDLTAAPLPVQWVAFTAKEKDQSVLLEWQTAQEQNADRFIIERSNTNAAFQSIGSVTATGNTTTGTNYSFTDNDPLYGDNYYRLKQTDRDGNFSYSKTVRISFEGRAGITLSPNPAQDNLTIRLPANQTAKNITVTDAAGRLVLRYAPGNAQTITIPVQNLSKGMYWLQLQTGGKSYRMPFMKH